MNKRLLLLLISNLILTIPAFSQNYFTRYASEFSTTNSLIGKAAFQTPDSGFIFLSNFPYSGSTTQDLNIVKTNANGVLVWGKDFTGPYQVGGSMVRNTLDGGYIITGETNNYSGWLQVFLIKLNANGDTLWTRFYTDNSNPIINDVWPTSDSGFVMVGDYDQMGIFIVKADKNGTRQFSYRYNVTGINKVGYSIRETTDHGFIISGEGQFNGTGIDIVLLRLNSVGQSLWMKKYGKPDQEIGKCVQQTFDGGFIVTGYTSSYGNGAVDVCLMKTDSMGVSSWVTTFGGTQNDVGNYVEQTADSDYIITGSTLSFPATTTEKTYLIKADQNGNLSWSRTLGPVRGETVEQMSDGGYLIGGVGAGVTSCLIKTDSSATLNCNVEFPGTVTSMHNFTDTVLVVTRIAVGDEYSYGFPFYPSVQAESPCIANSISDININDNITLYPNPVQSGSKITFSKPLNNTDVTITDLLGKVVLKSRIYGNELLMDNKIISKGIYLVLVNSVSENFIRKLVVN